MEKLVSYPKFDPQIGKELFKSPNLNSRKVQLKSIIEIRRSLSMLIRAGHFLTKVKKSTGTIWISFINTPSSTKKKELGLYLISRPNRKNCPFLPQNTKEKRHFLFFWFSYSKIMSKIICDFTYTNVWSRRKIWYPYCHTFATFYDGHKCHIMT